MTRSLIAKMPCLTEKLVLIDGKLNQAFVHIYDDETQEIVHDEVVEKDKKDENQQEMFHDEVVEKNDEPQEVAYYKPDEPQAA